MEGEPTGRTDPVPNAADPSWEDEIEISIPAGCVPPFRLRVRVWDDDVTKEDDAIACAEVELSEEMSVVGTATAIERKVLTGRAELPDCEVSFKCELKLAWLWTPG